MICLVVFKNFSYNFHSMREFHPYGEFIPKNVQGLIIGTFPIRKFTARLMSEIKPHEIDFHYGGEGNQLWKLLGASFELELTSKEAIQSFLEKQKLGVGDLIRSCRRKNQSSLDKDLYDIEWNTNLIELIQKHEIKNLYFTGKGVRQWFDRYILKPANFKPNCELITLLTPASTGARAIGNMEEYKRYKDANPLASTFDFRLEFYRSLFIK